MTSRHEYARTPHATGRTRRRTRLVAGLLARLLLGALVLPPAAAGASDESRLDAVVDELFALDMTPGLAVAVVRGNEIVYTRGVGIADLDTGRAVQSDTLFYIASVTKPLTSLAVALLDHDGTLDLDAPITAYLPTLTLAPPLDAGAITLRDLLTMTHGIDGGGPVVMRTAFSGEFTPELLIELLGDYAPDENGRDFTYGNLGPVIAGMAIEAVTGESWKDAVARHVLAPAGMTSTAARRSRVDAGRLAMPHAPTPDGFRRLPYTKDDANMHAAGGHVTTAGDMARFLVAQLDGGRIDGERVFPAEVIAATQTQQAAQDRNVGAYHRHGWGLGWDLATWEGERMVQRFGTYPGFRPHVSFLPEHDLGVVVLVNDGMLGGMFADILANALYAELLGKAASAEERARARQQIAQRVAMGRQRLAEDLERRAGRAQDLPRPLAAYAGTYENQAMGRLDCRVVDDRLEIAYGLARAEAEVYEAATHKLRVELTGRGEVVTFAPAESGHDTAPMASLTWGGRLFQRVDG